MAEIVKRDIEKEILKWIESREILAIVGPRQCGKTTLLERLKDNDLIRELFDKVIYVTFEDDFEKIKFEKDPKEHISFLIGENKKNLILFDEVQYIDDAGKKLKLIYDLFSNVKMIISGSSSLDIRDVGKMLVGRVIFFGMFPFSFEEFLSCKNQEAYQYYVKNKIGPDYKMKSHLFIDLLNKYLEEYLIYGGYPRIVLEKNNENKKVLIKNLFLTYVEKDIVKIYGDKYRGIIHGVVKYLASTSGNMINYYEIASLNGINFKDVKNILHILEDTFVIKILKPFYKNLSTELKKNPKIYFVDLGFRNFILDRFSFNDEEKGLLLENYTLSCLRGRRVNYWRTTAKAEVDFVLSDELIPIEVKAVPKITRSFRSFLKSYSPKKAFLVNLMESEKVDVEKTEVFIVPASLLDFQSR